MSRIDQHISGIRNKLAMAEFLHAWAQAMLVAALIGLAYTLLRQFTLMILPGEWIMLWSLLGLTVVYGLIVGVQRRPDALVTAVAIDDRLGLREKFSTALHARRRNDPFSQAAVADAEQTAAKVDLRKKFPIVWPKALGYMLTIGCVAAALLLFVQPRNLLASDTPKPAPKAPDTDAQAKAKDKVNSVLKAIEVAPKVAAEKESIQLAKAELKALMKAPNVDPAAAQRKAQAALQDLREQIKEIEKTKNFAEAKLNERMLEKMDPGDEKGPVADAQRDIAKGNMAGAMDKLDDVVKNFDKMDEKKQQEAAKQMQKMAQQLQQMANNPQQQQQMQQKLQQMGMNQQQAQQAMQALQQAAQGNQQAAQQLQQMAQQAAQQLNNGQGPTQQQQQQIQQMMQQLQAQANTQQQAAQLQQAAAAMGQAMQAAAQQQAGNQPGQGQPNTQATQGQNAGNTPGQQPGGQTPQQQMAQAQQQMQQQLQQMQAIAQDAQQVAAAQQAANQAGNQPGNQPGQQGGPGQQPGGNGQGQQPGDGGQGPFAEGDPNNKPGQGQGGPGQGAGGNIGLAEASFTTKQEVSKSKDNEKGKVIAASFVKADALKGESKADMKEVAKNAVQEATDEVDSERVGRQAQKVVRDYFGSLAEEK